MNWIANGDCRRRFLNSSSSKSSSKAKSRKTSSSSDVAVKSAINRVPSSQSSRSNLVSSPSPKGTNSELSDQDERGVEMNPVRLPGSTPGGSRTNLLRSGRGRTDSIREEDEGDHTSERLAKSPSNNILDGERAKTAVDVADTKRARQLSTGKQSQQLRASTPASADGESDDETDKREAKRGSVIEKVASKAKFAFPLRKAKESASTENSPNLVKKSTTTSPAQYLTKKEIENQERRPLTEQGQGDKERAKNQVTASSSAANKQKKLPTPLITKGSDTSSSPQRDGISRNASVHTATTSPNSGVTGKTVLSRSTSDGGLSISQDIQPLKSSSVKKSNKIIHLSTVELETESKSLPLNSPLTLNKPSAEAKRKPSMNSIKEGVETTSASSEQHLPAGEGPAQVTNADSHGLNKPNNLRSTSALKINSMSNATSSNAVTTKSSSNQPPPRERKAPTFEPPMPESENEPDAEPAPPSGMYWFKAPCFGYDHNALRAHTTTLIGSNIYVFGGCDSHACFNNLYIFDADCMYWTAPDCRGEIPPVLRAMTATAVSKKIVIFGGGDGPAYYNDVYVLDTLNLRYSKPRINGALPSKRRAHTACLYKHGIYVFGGGDGVKALNDIWRLDVSDTTRMAWKLISAPSKSAGRPTARGYHTANMVGSKLIIFGGSDGLECFRDVWVFDADTQIWRAVEIKVSFPRLSHTATVIGSYLFVIGGHDGVEYSSDVLLLNLVTMQWDKRKVYGTAPSGRGYHGTVLHDSRLFVIGGFDG